ncbi:hypothetical protein B0T18DRAFT_237169 [Schizothecium vesticola]|uniref:Uncharacterized protein n=1 Tax=Schizothecium vesticola TaxID=314040 RepID=A0AA40BPP0_9PEZI|nr:hypothetical protein B0T18DRAFT_237169 [Schizothecium vesticola]
MGGDELKKRTGGQSDGHGEMVDKDASFFRSPRDSGDARSYRHSGPLLVATWPWMTGDPAPHTSDSTLTSCFRTGYRPCRLPSIDRCHHAFWSISVAPVRELGGCTCDICRYWIAVDRHAGTSALLHLDAYKLSLMAVQCKLWSRILLRTIWGRNAALAQRLVASSTVSRLSKPRTMAVPLMQQTQMPRRDKYSHDDRESFGHFLLFISRSANSRIASAPCASNPLDVSSRSSPSPRTAGCRSLHQR